MAKEEKKKSLVQEITEALEEISKDLSATADGIDGMALDIDEPTRILLRIICNNVATIASIMQSYILQNEIDKNKEALHDRRE